MRTIDETERYIELMCKVIDQLNANNSFTLYVAMMPDGEIIVSDVSNFPDFVLHAFKVTNEDITDTKIRNGTLV